MRECDTLIKVLLLGEGDFSFALSLGRRLEAGSASIELTATSFDTESEVLMKYGESRSILKELQKHSIRVLHSIDATQKEGSLSEKYEHIVFTFPHIGREDARAHYALLVHFFWAHKDRGKSLHLTLTKDQAERWRAVEAAERQGLSLCAKNLFLDTQFPMYTRRRSHRGKSFRTRVEAEAVTLSFSLPVNQTTFQGPPWLHLPQVLNINEALYTCSLCQRQFKNERSLERHIQDAPHRSADNNQEAPCSFCGQAFVNAEALERHIQAKHSPFDIAKPEWWYSMTKDRSIEEDSTDDILSCSICGLEFTTDADLKQHLVKDLRPPSLETQPSSPSLCCSVCNRGFKDLRALQQHALYKQHRVDLVAFASLLQ